jgi:hypothetical protein
VDRHAARRQRVLDDRGRCCAHVARLGDFARRGPDARDVRGGRRDHLVDLRFVVDRHDHAGVRGRRGDRGVRQLRHLGLRDRSDGLGMEHGWQQDDFGRVRLARHDDQCGREQGEHQRTARGLRAQHVPARRGEELGRAIRHEIEQGDAGGHDRDGSGPGRSDSRSVLRLCGAHARHGRA